MRNNVIYINNKQIAGNQIYLTPVGGYAHFNNKLYYGAFIVAYKKGAAHDDKLY